MNYTFKLSQLAEQGSKTVRQHLQLVTGDTVQVTVDLPGRLSGFGSQGDVTLKETYDEVSVPKTVTFEVVATGGNGSAEVDISQNEDANHQNGTERVFWFDYTV